MFCLGLLVSAPSLACSVSGLDRVQLVSLYLSPCSHVLIKPQLKLDLYHILTNVSAFLDQIVDHISKYVSNNIMIDILTFQKHCSQAQTSKEISDQPPKKIYKSFYFIYSTAGAAGW